MEQNFYTRDDIEQSRFYQLPKALIENERYDKLSATAKIAYAILKDRHELSLSNGWIDEKGVYFLFSDKQLATILKMSVRTANRVKNDLQDYKLIYMERTGLNSPNKIYLCKMESAENPVFARIGQKWRIQTGQNCPIQTGQKWRIRTSQKWRTNDTKDNKTDFNDTEYNNHHPAIEHFNQLQSNMIHEFIQKQKLDDDEVNKLTVRLKGKNFKHPAYIEKAYETMKNAIQPDKPTRTEYIPEHMQDDFEQPKNDDPEIDAKRAALKAKLDKLKGE